MIFINIFQFLHRDRRQSGHGIASGQFNIHAAGRQNQIDILIGKGYTMEEAMKEVKMVVEGVYSAKAAMGLASKYGVQLPIIEQVNEVLFQGKPAAEAVRDLMLRDKKIEISDTEWS